MSDRLDRPLVLLLVALGAASACDGSRDDDRALRERYREAAAGQDVARARDAVEEFGRTLPDTPEATIELARMLAAVGETNRARWVLQDALERHPDRDDLALGLAEVSLLVGDGGGALRAVERVGEGSPRYPYARILQARAEILLGDLDQGLATLEAGEARFPDSEMFRLERIEVLHAEQRLEPALALARDTLRQETLRPELRRALRLREADLAGAVEGPEAALALLAPLLAADPASVEVLQRRTALLTAEGRADAARSELESAIERAPERGGLHVLLAQARLATGDLAGAEQALRQHLAREPGPLAATNLALFLHRGGRADEGAAVLAAVPDGPDSPERLELRYLHVAMLIEAGALPEARDRFAAFRAASPDDPRVGYLEARLALTQGDPEAAVRTLSQVVARLDRPDVQHLLGLALERSGDVPGAELRFGLATSRNPQQLESWLGLLRTLEAQGKWEGLIAAATTVIRLAPTQAEGFAALVRAHLALGELASAEAVLREQTERFPALPGPRAALAFALRRQGRDAEALALLDAAPESSRNDPLLRAERAVLLGRLGRVEEGLALLAEGADPEATPELRRARIYLLMAAGRTDEALAGVEREAEREPGDATVLVMAGDYLSSRRAFAPAAEHYRRALERSPADAGVSFRLGVALDESGDTAGAIAAYRRASELDEDAVAPRNNLALALGRQGATQEALQAAQAAYGLDDSDPVVMDTLASLYLQTGLAERAVALLEKARGLAPEADDVLYHLALGYRATGRTAEARELLDALRGRLAPGHSLEGPVGEALASLP